MPTPSCNQFLLATQIKLSYELSSIILNSEILLTKMYGKLNIKQEKSIQKLTKLAELALEKTSIKLTSSDLYKPTFEGITELFSEIENELSPITNSMINEINNFITSNFKGFSDLQKIRSESIKKHIMACLQISSNLVSDYKDNYDFNNN